VVDILEGSKAAGWVIMGMKLDEEVVEIVEADGACETVEVDGVWEE